MVYCGKPSRGCNVCKSRRIKCDEVRPACTQCKKSNRSCPGYPDEFDLIFRNETSAVKRRAQRALSASNSKNNKVRSSSSKKKSPPASTPTLPEASTPRKFQISAQTDAAEKIPIPSLDADSSHDSMSDSSPHSDIQDDDTYFISHSDAVAIARIKGFKEPQVLIAGSPTDQISPVHVSPSSSVKYPSLGYSTGFDKFSVPWGMVNGPSEIDSVPYFFRKHVLLPRHSDSQRGFLELLKEMYEESKPNSLLQQATRAVALGTMSNAYQSRPMRCEARKIYGNALQDLGLAIQRPNQTNADELLMTILLFSLYEQVTMQLTDKTLWTNHIRGAVTLVKLRGNAQLQSARSARLFRAVRTQMLTAAIQRGEPLEEYPDEKGWRCDEDLGVNAANRLSIICLDIPYIKFYAKELLARKMTAETVAEMLALITQAQKLDRRLEAWVHSLPDTWKPHIAKVVTDEPPDLVTALFWPGPVHTYEDLNVANVTNEYRICRIFCQDAIMKCIDAMPVNSRPEHLTQYYTQGIYITRRMVNDFSSSIPYLLGFNYYSRPDACPADEKATRATGAFFATWPLWVVKKIPCLSEDHQNWLLYRLIHIGVSYGLSETKVKEYSEIRGKLAQAPAYQ